MAEHLRSQHCHQFLLSGLPIKNGAAIPAAPRPVSAALPKLNLPPLALNGEKVYHQKQIHFLVCGPFVIKLPKGERALDLSKAF